MMNVYRHASGVLPECAPERIAERLPDRITLVIGSLESGGAQRVMTTMANYWADCGRTVSLVAIYDESAGFFPLDERVRHVPLGLGRSTSGALSAITGNLRRIKRLRDALIDLQPEVVVSFMTEVNVLTLLATRGTGIPLVISERSDPTLQSVRPGWKLLRRLTYRAAAAVVAQTPEVGAWATKLTDSSRITILPNPVIPPAPKVSSDDEERLQGLEMGDKSIVGVGRLAHEKGFDLLIRAFAEVHAEHPQWSLVILGEGAERPQLERLTAELGLSGVVRLPGLVANPMTLLPSTGIFVLPSRYEGFPNALLEAMAGGLAVIAADCPSGPRQIVRDGIDGILLPSGDIPALVGAMKALMESEALRQRLGRRATEVTDRFGIETIMMGWNALLSGVAFERRELDGKDLS